MTREPDDEDDGAEPGPNELRDAEALAAALEGRDAGTGGPPPGDALPVAALLRHAHGAAALPADLEARVTESARPELDARRARQRRRTRLWAASALLVPAAAALILLLPMTPSYRRAAPPPAFVLPAPSAALLRAQAAAARGDGRALAVLDQRMRAYRRQYLDQLSQHAGGAR